MFEMQAAHCHITFEMWHILLEITTQQKKNLGFGLAPIRVTQKVLSLVVGESCGNWGAGCPNGRLERPL